ncbi:hypothetical protein PIB30_096429, partial [Stylosanthes scabra]|nr:hypothetical protein [Stylosanthes scabra]
DSQELGMGDRLRDGDVQSNSTEPYPLPPSFGPCCENLHVHREMMKSMNTLDKGFERGSQRNKNLSGEIRGRRWRKKGQREQIKRMRRLCRETQKEAQRRKIGQWKQKMRKKYVR